MLKLAHPVCKRFHRLLPKVLQYSLLHVVQHFRALFNCPKMSVITCWLCCSVRVARGSGMMSFVRFTLRFCLDFVSFGIVDCKVLHWLHHYAMWNPQEEVLDVPLFLLGLVHQFTILRGACGGAVGWGTALQAGRSRVQFPMVSMGFFHWHNPSGHTLALGLTQPLKEMNTRNVSWG
jgi:hypothetical protein